MNDIAPTRFKWVGTRPIRPDGVPKVTGRAMYGADFATAGTLYGKIIRSPHAHARIRSIDTSKAEALPGVKAVVTAKDFPDHKFEYIGPERVAQNFWHMTRNVMAREKALYEGHAVAAIAAISKSVADEAASLIAIDYEVLPHVIDVDEAMKPDAPLLFEDMITRGIEPAPTRPSNISKRIEFKIGDTDGGLCRGRRDRRQGVQDGGGAPSLYRAACLRRPVRCRRPGRDLGLEPRAFRDPRADRETARHAGRRYSRDAGRDRRRLRRQDHRLPRAGRHLARQEIGAAGQDRDEPRRGVQSLGADLRLLDAGQDRRQEGRHDHRGRRRVQVPSGRLPRLAGDERVPLRLCALQHPEPAYGRLRRRVQPAEIGRLPGAGLADLGLCGRERARHSGKEDRHGPAANCG